MTTTTARDLRTELDRLRAAKPSTVVAFNEARTARIAEIEALLEGATVELDDDPAHEKLLRRLGGGDKFDRRRV